MKNHIYGGCMQISAKYVASQVMAGRCAMFARILLIVRQTKLHGGRTSPGSCQGHRGGGRWSGDDGCRNRYLDNVGDHPIVTLNKLHEETREVLANMESVKRVLINKRKGSGFTEVDIEVLEVFEDEVADIITCSKTVLIKLQEWYGRPVIGIMQRHVEKLEREEYCTKRKSPAATGLW